MFHLYLKRSSILQDAIKYHEKNNFESEVFVAIHDKKLNTFYSFATCKDFEINKVLEFAQTKGMKIPLLEKRIAKFEKDTTNETETKK